MSKKVKKKNKSSNAVKNMQKSPKTTDKRMLALIIIMSVVFLAIAVGLTLIIQNISAFNYIEEDLSEYIELKSDDYKSLSHGFSFDDELSDDVDRLINALLCKNKNQTPLHDGQSTINVPISLGDVAKIHYRGYRVDENGNQIPIDDNLFSQSAYKLEIGSGNFIPGLEEALIGVIPKQYQRTVEKVSDGKLTVFDAVYLSYKAIYPNGTSANVYAERIDLRLSGIDKKYGEGFKSFLLGGNIEIGEKIKDQKIFTLPDGDAIYYDMTVEYVVRDAQSPLTIDVVFPQTYQEVTLRGVAAKFDVYIEGVIVYDTPEYDEAFIKNVLKISDDELNKYEGSNALERHRAMLLNTARENENAARISTFENIIWTHLLSKAKTLKLPKSELDLYFDAEYERLKSLYSYYQSYYPDFDDFARAYYSLSSSADWREYVNSLASKTVTKKLIIYYIMAAENLTPEKEEYERLYNENLELYLNDFIDAHKTELEDAKTDEEREEIMEKIKKEVLDYYGDEFFMTNVYYDIVIRSLMKWNEYPVL
jgi:FKBP-type peptidyl-prolyl cis-trans isomerase (trigger factor)